MAWVRDLVGLSERRDKTVASTTSPDDCHPEAGVAGVAWRWWCGAVVKTDDKKLFKYFENSD